MYRVYGQWYGNRQSCKTLLENLVNGLLNLKLNYVQSIWAVPQWYGRKQPVMQDIVRRFSKWSAKFETELCTEYMGTGQGNWLAISTPLTKATLPSLQAKDITVSHLEGDLS